MASTITNLIPITTLPAALPGTPQYTVPANTRTQFDSVTLTNTTATARVVTLHLVPSGGAAASGTIIESSITVPANKTVPVYSMALQVLLAGGMLYAFADAASAVNLRASGREITL